MTDVILRPLTVHDDNRGSVREAYRESWFPGLPPIRQAVHSESKQGVMRAMHAHRRQTDIWHFTKGEAQVQTYDHLTGDWQNIVVDGERTIVIPPGVSHGFLALTDVTLTYFLTEEFNPDLPDEAEWDAFSKGWPGAKAWKLSRLRKTDPYAYMTTTVVTSPSFGGAPMSRAYTKADLIRSQRDLDAPSLGEFAAKW